MASRRGRGKLLDIGCGMGFFLRQAQLKHDAYGCELSAFAAGRAEGLAAGRVIVSNVGEGLAFSSGSFDIVTAFDVAEHLAEPRRLFSEAERLLRPGGFFVFSTPNPNSVGRSLKGRQWSGSRDETHVSVKTPREWLALCGPGFRIWKVHYDGLWDAPYIRPSWAERHKLLGLMANVPQTIMFTLPSVLLSYLGWGTPERLGENIYVYCQKKRE